MIEPLRCSTIRVRSEEQALPLFLEKGDGIVLVTMDQVLWSSDRSDFGETMPPVMLLSDDDTVRHTLRYSTPGLQRSPLPIPEAHLRLLPLHPMILRPLGILEEKGVDCREGGTSTQR